MCIFDINEVIWDADFTYGMLIVADVPCMHIVYILQTSEQIQGSVNCVFMLNEIIARPLQTGNIWMRYLTALAQL